VCLGPRPVLRYALCHARNLALLGPVSGSSVGSGLISGVGGGLGRCCALRFFLCREHLQEKKQ
jgi:outer membrane lipoprotein SlyB